MSTATVLVTKRPQNRNKNEVLNRFDDLINAVLCHWSESPEGDLSVRKLTSSVGAPGSSIAYHFGGIERLYVEASRRALEHATHWMDGVLLDLAGLKGQPISADFQASCISAVIERWVSGERRLAMAWRRTKALPGSDDALAIRADWDQAWTGFWTTLGEIIGLHQYGKSLAAFADGEACRHLLGWRDVLEVSLLHETTHALVAWLGERRIAGDACRLTYRQRVSECFADLVDDTNRPVTAFGLAAASLLAREGRSGVTFRAVAEEANSTLGTVSHYFGSKSNLLRAALYRLYEREAMPARRDDLPQYKVAPPVILGQCVSEILKGLHPVLRAYDEIELAIYNDPDFLGLRAAVRCMDDPIGTWALRQMLGGQEPSQSLVGAYSSVCRGAGHLSGNTSLPLKGREEIIRAALEPICLA